MVLKNMKNGSIDVFAMKIAGVLLIVCLIIGGILSEAAVVDTAISPDSAVPGTEPFHTG